MTAGFDYSFGDQRVRYDGRYEESSDGVYETNIVGKVTDNADKISSTRIRKLLSEGNVGDASL